MRYATIITDEGRQPALVHPTKGVIPVARLLPDFRGDLMSFIASGRRDEAGVAAEAAKDDLFLPLHTVRYAAPYLAPTKILGIGLNYVEHANDLAELVPDEPASFIKANHTIIGPREPIVLPRQSQRVTAEAELGLVIGRHCRDVPEEDALDYVFGLCPILDQTAEDILQRNPRFLTRAKNFPSFFSFGPHIVPLNEALGPGGDVADVQVATVLNGAVERRNTVRLVRFPPSFLVSFHSAVMPLFPGDVISTGTPGAVVIRPGDVVECRIDGLEPLVNPVVGG